MSKTPQTIENCHPMCQCEAARLYRYNHAIAILHGAGYIVKNSRGTIYATNLKEQVWCNVPTTVGASIDSIQANSDYSRLLGETVHDALNGPMF